MEKDAAQIISENLLYWLDRRNTTQTELAEFVGVSQATVSQWISGKKSPRMGKVDRICEFFRIKRSQLLSDIDTYYETDEAAQIAQQIFDDPDLKLLFDAARDARAEDIRLAADMLKRFKKSNPEG